MRGDTVEEPAVMRYDNCTSGKVLETFLQCPDGIYIHIIGRFIEQEHIPLLLEGKGQMKPVPLSSRKDTAQLLLIGTREIEPGHVCPRVYFPVAEFHEIGIVGYRPVHSLVRIDTSVLLVHIRQLDSVPYRDCPGIRSLDSHDQTEQCGLSRSVRAYDSHNACRRQYEIQMLEQEPVTVCLRHIIELDHLAAETRPVRYIDLQIGLFLLAVLSGQFLVCSETGLRFGLAGFRSHSDPLKLPLKSLAPLALLLFLLCKPQCLLFQP